MQSYSQANQDKWVIETLNGKRDGFFVELGAYDGIQGSNTYALEKDFGWKGICVEANADVFKALERNRKSTNVNIAVMDYRGECRFGRDAIDTPPFISTLCDTLDCILEWGKAPNVIDYASIDIEGCEYRVLKDFPFDKWKIKLITIEHNAYIDGTAKQEQLFELLSSRGFTRAVKDAPCLDPNPSFYMKPYEDWYINNTF